MKKKLGIVLSIPLIISLMALPSFAATVDTTTSATVPAAPAPSALAAPKAPVAPSNANGSIDTSKLAGGTVYTVVSGDVFWNIAQKNNLTIDALAKLNPHIKNINWIYPGDKLIVKEAAAVAPVVAPAVAAKKLFHGFGEVTNYRDNSARGANSDNLNITTASALFDENGKIVDLTWDVLEITPKLFSGWIPTGADQATKDAFIGAINDQWETKTEEGYNYDMTHKISKGAADNASGKEWFEQLNFYESYFKGKTVAEVEAWANKYTDVNKRPFKMAYPEKMTEADKAATASFTAEEKAMLVDVTTGATMSLQDVHSHFLNALKEAYAAQVEVKQ